MCSCPVTGAACQIWTLSNELQEKFSYLTHRNNENQNIHKLYHWCIHNNINIEISKEYTTNIIEITKVTKFHNKLMLVECKKLNNYFLLLWQHRFQNTYYS